MTGAEACLAIRELAPDMPIILCSGYAGGEVVDAVRDLAGVPFLAKPYPIATLYRAVARALGDERNDAAPVTLMQAS